METHLSHGALYSALNGSFIRTSSRTRFPRAVLSISRKRKEHSWRLLHRIVFRTCVWSLGCNRRSHGANVNAGGWDGTLRNHAPSRYQ